jgi:hypothetical protein
MAYTIEEIHNRFLQLIDKEKNGYITPEEIDRLLDIAQMEELNELYGNPRKDGVPMHLGRSQSINDQLSPFVKSYALSNANTSGGTVSMPSDYLFSVTLYYHEPKPGGFNKRFVTPITEEELSYRLTSQVIPTSQSNPVYVHRQGALKVFDGSSPASTFAGELVYLKRPSKPRFGYTQSGRTIIYNPNPILSTQMEWFDSSINNIIYRAISIGGFTLADVNTAQYGDAKQKEGS